MYTEDYSIQPYSTPESEEQHTLRDVMRLLFRHKWKILFVFFLMAFLGTATVLTQPEQYQSEVKILVNMRPESLSVDPTVAATMIGAGRNDLQIINTELAIIRSKEVASQVVQKIGVDRMLEIRTRTDADDPKEPGPVASLIRRALKIQKLSKEDRALERYLLRLEVTNKENVITATYRALDPQLAHDVLQELVQTYRDRHIQVLVPEMTPKFFEDQTAQALAELTEKEREMNQFKGASNLESLDEQKALLVQQVGMLHPLIAQIESELSAAQATAAYLEKVVNQQPLTKDGEVTPVLQSPTSESLHNRLIDLKLQLGTLQNRYPDHARNIVELKAEIQQVEDALKGEYERLQSMASANPAGAVGTLTAFSPVVRLQEAKTAMTEFQARLDSLKKELVANQLRLRELNSHELTYNRLKREIQDLNEIYAQFSENHKRALMAVTLETAKVSNLRVIQPPVVPAKSMKTVKEKYRNIALAIFVGFFAGLALAVVSEFFDHTIKSGADIEKRLGIPVLASFSAKDFKSCI